MIHYLVKCPSDPYENTDCFGDLDRAWDICLSLAEEYGYAEVGYYNVQGHYQLVGDYCFNWLWHLKNLKKMSESSREILTGPSLMMKTIMLVTPKALP